MKVIIDNYSNNNMIDNAWAGANDTLEDLTYEEITTIRSNLEEIYPEGITMTDLNDFLWFERDTIAEWLGYETYDEMLEEKKIIKKLAIIDKCKTCTYYDKCRLRKHANTKKE